MIEIDYELSAQITNALRAQRRRRKAGFSPSSLFAASEPGVWLDPSDLSTLFQDTAGTTPVTAAGQSVALMRDKSGRSNHATQATAASRPTLARVPIGGARNIARFSAADTRWQPAGTTPPTVLVEQTHLGHPCASITFAANTPAGFGSSRADRNIVGVTHPTGPGITFAMESTISLSRQLTGTEQVVVYQTGSSGANNLVLTAANTASLVNVWQRVTHPVTTTTGNTGSAFPAVFVSQALGAQPLTVYIRDIQIEVGAASTEYQRTTTIHDVTQEGLRDCWYLSFDGVDDFLITPTITPGTDKVQVFAGIRKLSDAAAGVIAEHSASVALNNGGLALSAPASAAANITFGSKGTVQADAAYTNAAVAAPVTTVVAGLGDVAGDVARLRVNGTQAAQSTADQGTGNYLAYPLYIGRRGGTTLPFNGHLYGLITRFGPNLTADQIAQAERWMNSKTGAY